MDIYFVDTLPEAGQGHYIDYYHRSYSRDGWEAIDLEKLLSSRHEEFYSAIEAWHTQLCARGSRASRWWWLLPASRLILWHPPVFKPLVFALAAAEKIETLDVDVLHLVGCPTEAGKYLREVCPGVRVHDGRKLRKPLERALRNLLACLKFMLEVLGYILLRKERKGTRGASSPVVVLTYGLISGAQQGTATDHFFGDMFDPRAFAHPVHWVVFDSPLNALRAKGANDSPELRTSLYDWLGIREWWSLVKFCLLEGFLLRKAAYVSGFAFNGRVSTAFAKNYASEMIDGLAPYVEYAGYLGMKKLARELSPRAVVYPYEEKCLERGLLMAIGEDAALPRAVGYAHAVYNKGLMYVRRRNDAHTNPPSPDALLVTGPALEKWLVDWAGWDERRLFVVGSPRHHRMMERVTRTSFTDRPLRILILISLGHEATVLSNQLRSAPDAFDGCEVIIRPYPYSFQEEQDAAYAKIQGICPHIRVAGGSLADQLAWCDIAVYCSTTAGLESMLSGRLTVYLDLNHIFFLNPINEKMHDEVLWQCKDVSELREMLGRVKGMTTERYAEITARQNTLAEGILQGLDREGLNAFFQEGGERSNQAWES